MREKTLYSMGVDIKRTWNFKNGDLELVKYDENIGQAVINRLSCLLNSLDIFYDEYGSLIHDYLGEKNVKSTREYIRLEIEKRLLRDPRLKNVDCTVDSFNNHTVKGHLTLTFLNDDVYEDNFVLGVQ